MESNAIDKREELKEVDLGSTLEETSYDILNKMETFVYLNKTVIDHNIESNKTLIDNYINTHKTVIDHDIESNKTVIDNDIKPNETVIGHIEPNETEMKTDIM
ncbi:unnamed protein product [Brassicogethes aeneus]|uniref:Uncharacterized protein n=1 Tax=Brassicogethes aeneus TaxID=1431903 RepID=A0A9P0AZD6_BRAAE|nr:unnamed protein product [Brassicogethes aeneus]